MDALEKYKQSWNHQSEEKNKFSTEQIYNFTHKKSSSVVKWIFIIGILEFVFWGCITFMLPDSVYKMYENLEMTTFFYVSSVIHYLVLLIFIYLFYKNYKQISVLENTKKLIKSILKVRKTVKYYVIYNLLGFIFGGITINFFMFSDTDKLQKAINFQNLHLDIDKVVIYMMIGQLIVISVFTLLLWLFYKLAYGILLKKLNKNYAELIKLDGHI